MSKAQTRIQGGKPCICGAEIRWGKDELGAPHPFNADGTSHFINCPFVSERRKRIQAGKPKGEKIKA